MVKIAPSILSADFSKLPEQIDAINNSSADWIHLDIMDGNFVPNITFGPLVVKGVRKLSSLPLDVHLMIANPDDYIDDFYKAGADIITVHYETCTHLWRTLEYIKSLNIKAGVTLNPATPVNLLDPVLGLVDMVLIMSVEPGFGGQKFIPEMMEKAAYLHNKKIEKKLNFDIEIDGGIDPETAPLVVEKGVNILVAGSFVFKNNQIEQNIKSLRDSISGR